MRRRQPVAVAVIVALGVLLASVGQAQSFRSGGDQPPRQWIQALPDTGVPDISPETIMEALDRAGWVYAIPIPGTEVQLPGLEVAVSEEYGAVGQRMTVSGSVFNGSVTNEEITGGDFLLSVDPTVGPSYKTMRLSGDLDKDINRAADFYQGTASVGAEPLSWEALRSIILQRYAANAAAARSNAEFISSQGRGVRRRGAATRQGEIQQPPVGGPSPQLFCEMNASQTVRTEDIVGLVVARTKANLYAWSNPSNIGGTHYGTCTGEVVPVEIGVVRFTTHWYPNTCVGPAPTPISGGHLRADASGAYYNEDFPALTIGSTYFPGSRVWAMHSSEITVRPESGSYSFSYGGVAWGNNGIA